MSEKLINKTKICSKCNKELPIECFAKDKTRKDGLQGWCRECCSKYHQTYRQTHKEYYSQYNKEYRQTHKEHLNQYKKEYRQTNKEHISQYQKEWQQANKEHRSQYQKEWQNQYKGYYVYIILNKQDNVAYVGQTSNYYKRLMQHLSGGVDSTKELFANGDWSCIKYLDVSNLVESEMELRALENELIELYQPRCNTQLNIIKDIDEDRLFSLVSTLHSILNEWEIFKTNV